MTLPAMIHSRIPTRAARRAQMRARGLCVAPREAVMLQGCTVFQWAKCAAIVAACVGACASGPAACIACMGGAYSECKDCL
jgi:hypothetical protein